MTIGDVLVLRIVRDTKPYPPRQYHRFAIFLVVYPRPCSSLQSQHLLHAVESRLLLRQPLCGADGAVGAGAAVVGIVD